METAFKTSGQSVTPRSFRQSPSQFAEMIAASLHPGIAFPTPVHQLRGPRGSPQPGQDATLTLPQSPITGLCNLMRYAALYAFGALVQETAWTPVTLASAWRGPSSGPARLCAWPGSRGVCEAGLQQGPASFTRAWCPRTAEAVRRAVVRGSIQDWCLKGLARSFADRIGRPKQNALSSRDTRSLCARVIFKASPACGGATPNVERFKPLTSSRSKPN